MENKELLDNIIIGRVEPYIYAFSTNAVPNDLKIGETYRPVSSRLNEWKAHYPDLKEEFREKAMINDNVFFRDYAVHKYIQDGLGKNRLTRDQLEEGIYYSNEFFENASASDVKLAIDDIKETYKNNENKYHFYDALTNLPEILHFAREEKIWKPRSNQSDAIEKFKKAIDSGRKNLLMYAVMRFGKSFTSMMCAKEMNAKLVVVVSAKADVKIEWQKNVEVPKNFEGYEFITSKDLDRNNNLITEKLNEDKRIVAFLTLQDLKGELIKDKHKDIFRNKIDLLIIDETHFGARAETYGEILRNAKHDQDVKEKQFKDEHTLDELDENIKILDVDVKLHLSGTPYRILMSSEFEKDDIISFCQFSDIIEEQTKWDNENLLRDDVKEWDNPYFGFPQMIRFAFNPSKKAKEKLKEYKTNGYTYALSSLFKPKSKKKARDNSHKEFINENEVLELFEVIDGSREDENVLGFLDFDKIKQGKMCRHIVCVLPYRASCDALEKLLITNKEKFKNLNEYEIINISGVDNPNKYKESNDVKTKIRKCEKNNIKTLTLTVNKMLTGSTVEEWDTMIYLKDTSSPQEYDQAIFRLQSQFIKTYVDEKKDTIKYNMKPQTLLVDFDPYRLFALQEKKSMIYNVNVEETGNSLLKDILTSELKISPIITMNSNKIVEITPNDIMEAVSQYSKTKGIMDEISEIPVDLNLLNHPEIKNVIERQAEIGSNQGLFIDNTDEEEGDDIDIPSADIINNPTQESEPNNEDESETDEDKNDVEKQFRTYYARILFYSFLTEDKLISLSNIISGIDSNENNKRISKNLGLDIDILKLINQHMNAFILNQLDYTIQRINKLSKDESMDYIDRAQISINKFNKLSESEVVTPINVCNKMVDLIPNDYLRNSYNENGKILDIASKTGEFTLAIYNKYINDVGVEPEKMKDLIYTIPTSTVAYEFTRKIYEILGLNINNIAQRFNSYDLLEIKNGDNIDYLKIKNYLLQKKNFCDIELEGDLFIEEENKKMKFDMIIGNPPYQENIANRGEQPPLYHLFYDCATSLSKVVTLITPARFLFDAGKTPSVWNKKMLNDEHFKVVDYFPNSKDVFDSVDIKGGVAITYRNEGQHFGAIGTFVQDDMVRNILSKVSPKGEESLSQIIYSNTSYKYTSLFFSENEGFSSRVSGGSSRYLSSSVFDKFPEVFFDEKPLDGKNYIKIIGRKDSQRALYYFDERYINPPENFKNYKVYLASSNGTGMLGEALSEPIVGEPYMGSTETFVSFGNFETREEAENLVKYIRTKFARLMLGTKKVTQGNKKAAVWSNVPLQNFKQDSDIDWTKNVSEIDQQLYKKYNLEQDEIDYIESKIKEM